ncbi:MAG TPA: hypothetical protein VGI05_02330 [Streptosporangiaceae bacterium]|jgi:hypothetical protein
MGDPEDEGQQSAPDPEQPDEGAQPQQPDPEPTTPPDDGGVQPDHTYEV